MRQNIGYGKWVLKARAEGRLGFCQFCREPVEFKKPVPSDVKATCSQCRQLEQQLKQRNRDDERDDWWYRHHSEGG